MTYCHCCPGYTEKAVFDKIYTHGIIHGNGNRIRSKSVSNKSMRLQLIM